MTEKAQEKPAVYAKGERVVIGNTFEEAYAFVKEEGKKLGLSVVKEISEPVKVANNGPVPQKLDNQ